MDQGEVITTDLSEITFAYQQSRVDMRTTAPMEVAWNMARYEMVVPNLRITASTT